MTSEAMPPNRTDIAVSNHLAELAPRYGEHLLKEIMILI
jgi:hypothetical protein